MLLALTKDDSVLRLESKHLTISFSGDEQLQTIPLPLIDRVKYAEKTVIWQDIWNNQVMQWVNCLKTAELPTFFRMP